MARKNSLETFDAEADKREELALEKIARGKEKTKRKRPQKKSPAPTVENFDMEITGDDLNAFDALKNATPKKQGGGSPFNLPDDFFPPRERVAEFDSEGTPGEPVVETGPDFIFPPEVLRTDDVSAEAVPEIAEVIEPTEAEVGASNELEREIESLPPAERKKLGIGLNNIGFFVEAKKDEFFAGAIKKLIGQKGEKRTTKEIVKDGTLKRFLSSLATTFERDAESARKKMKEADEKGGKLSKLSNAGHLSGNVLKYGRVLADTIGYTAASPLKYVTAAGMFASRSFGAMQEARTKTEKLITKTRESNSNLAAEHAWSIYEEARAKSKNGTISAEELSTAYNEQIPQDLKARLERDNWAGKSSGIVQKIINKDVSLYVGSINRKIEIIKKDKKLTAGQKKAETEKILNKCSKRMQKLDKIVSNYGTVDALAMGAQYAESASKAVVYGTMVETLSMAMSKVWDNLANALSDHGEVKIGTTASLATHTEKPGSTKATEIIEKAVKPSGRIAGITETAKEAFAETPKISTTVEAQKGDTVWKILEKQLAEKGRFEGMNPRQKNALIASIIENKIKADPQAFGISSGDVDKIKTGEKINLSSLFGEKAESGIQTTPPVESSKPAVPAFEGSSQRRLAAELAKEKLEKLKEVQGTFDEKFSAYDSTNATDVSTPSMIEYEKGLHELAGGQEAKSGLSERLNEKLGAYETITQAEPPALETVEVRPAEELVDDSSQKSAEAELNELRASGALDETETAPQEAVVPDTLTTTEEAVQTLSVEKKAENVLGKDLAKQFEKIKKVTMIDLVGTKNIGFVRRFFGLQNLPKSINNPTKETEQALTKLKDLYNGIKNPVERYATQRMTVEEFLRKHGGK